MSDRYGYDEGRSGSGPEREPSEERGQAAWAARQPATPPPWSSAETQTGQAPPPWAFAPTHTGGVLPPTWPPPPPPAQPRAGLRRVLAVLAATLVLGAGAGAGAWYLTRDHARGTGAAPATSVSVTATTTPPQSPTPTPSASASLLTSSSSPSVGYRRAQDPVGYSVDVPNGWTRRQEQGKLARIVYYDAPSDGRQLQIFEVTESTPYDSLTLAETDPGYGFAKQPGYRVVQRDHGDTWAELTYRYHDQHKGTRQVIDHRFRSADGTLYAIRSSGPANLAPERVREPLRMAVRSFCPAGAQC
ncbi:hypothetical protein ACIBW9_20275 [Streptomyces sp. NPDC049541]|uniref:hypothetical protein n=1 Tax=Streptomyces sp. NPDC049541 TaxID=3365594 RepID=UPI00379B3AB7